MMMPYGLMILYFLMMGAAAILGNWLDPNPGIMAIMIAIFGTQIVWTLIAFVLAPLGKCKKQ